MISEEHQEPSPACRPAPAPGDRAQQPAADKRTLVTLELPELLAAVASLAASAPGAQLVRRLAPRPDPALVERRLRRLGQLRELLTESNPPTLSVLDQVPGILGRLGVDGVLLAPAELDLMADFLGAASSAVAFLAPGADRFDELFRLGNAITTLPELAKKLRRIVGPGGRVNSNASPELARLRKEAARARDRLESQLKAVLASNQYGGIFSDQIVTQRADRFVVPVKTDSKSKFKGIIHDTSGSGGTCFMEPLEAIEGNNQLALLRRQEKEEEERILREAAAELSANLWLLKENLATLAKLDCLLAQAEFCSAIGCESPLTNSSGHLELRSVRHPLLAWRQARGGGRAVPIQVEMPAEVKAVVISGANAGGKTATLKTVGLVTLMVMCGLQAPLVSGSRISLFRRVLAEVGDDQDLSRELSTFTAHASRLAHMAKVAGPNSLVLIDEIGAGTDPNEGAALAMAVLQWLKDHGAKVMTTTHFHKLKAFAAANPGVENVSVAFDQASGTPTYQLRYGLPGFSDALAVAGRLGFPPGLVEAAGANLEQGERATIELMAEAEKARQEALAARAAADSDRMAAAAAREEAAAHLAKARQERAGAANEGKRRVRQVARQMEKRLRDLLIEVKEKKAAGETVKQGREEQKLYAERRAALAEIDGLTQVETPPPPRPAEGGPVSFKEGDQVFINSLGQKGVLLKDPGPGEDTVPLSVGVGGVRLMAALADLSPLGAAAPKKPAPAAGRVAVNAAASDGLDLNLVGCRVDDALDKLDKALDQAVLANRGAIRVIHGRGTGALRNAVREHLTGHPLVARVSMPPREQGAVTLAELR